MLEVALLKVHVRWMLVWIMWDIGGMLLWVIFVILMFMGIMDFYWTWNLINDVLTEVGRDVAVSASRWMRVLMLVGIWVTVHIFLCFYYWMGYKIIILQENLKSVSFSIPYMRCYIVKHKIGNTKSFKIITNISYSHLCRNFKHPEQRICRIC